MLHSSCSERSLKLTQTDTEKKCSPLTTCFFPGCCLSISFIFLKQKLICKDYLLTRCTVIGRFDYVLAIIKILFLAIKYFYIFFLASFLLNDQNKNKAIHLFSVILAILFFFSLILLLTLALFVCCFFSISYFNFLNLLGSFISWQNETYLFFPCGAIYKSATILDKIL